jgi:hypothetical protein
MTLGGLSQMSIQAGTPGLRERVVVVSEDPAFWVDLRRGAPDLGPAWILANSARESLVAVEDSRVRVVVLDGAMREPSPNHLLRLLKKIRPDVEIVFAFQCPGGEWERDAREVGVLYYGDRSLPGAMIGVIRQTLRRKSRLLPEEGGAPPMKDGA